MWVLWMSAGFVFAYLTVGVLMDRSPCIDCESCRRMDCESMLDFDEVEEEETVVDV